MPEGADERSANGEALQATLRVKRQPGPCAPSMTKSSPSAAACHPSAFDDRRLSARRLVDSLWPMEKPMKSSPRRFGIIDQSDECNQLLAIFTTSSTMSVCHNEKDSQSDLPARIFRSIE
jgi:hypothetical protein